MGKTGGGNPTYRFRPGTQSNMRRINGATASADGGGREGSGFFKSVRENLKPPKVVSCTEGASIGSKLMFTLSPSSLRARLLALSALLSLSPMAASASVLMLDFGPTTVTGADQVNSPYHSINQTFTDTHWNTIGTSNPTTLVYSDGETASNITLTLGSSIGSSLVNFSTPPTTSSALGSSNKINDPGSVLAGTSVGKDGIFSSPVGQNLAAIRIGGLSAGTYEVYVMGANTNQSLEQQSTAAFYAAAMGNANTFETDGLTPAATTFLSLENSKSWNEGGTYGRFTITLTEGDYLYLATQGLGDGPSNELRGFLNAVQIVAIPEPSTLAFCALGLLLLPFSARVMRRKA